MADNTWQISWLDFQLFFSLLLPVNVLELNYNAENFTSQSYLFHMKEK